MNVPTQKILNQRVEGGAQNRAKAEKVQSHLLTILDRTPVFTAMADRTGALFYLNPAGRTLMGLENEDDLSGMTLVECQAPGAKICIAEEAMPAAERDGVWSGDSVLLSRDGREIRSFLTLIAHRDEAGHLEGFCLLGRDMGEWVRTEEALQITRNELWRLSAQHLTIQESERRRIAVDLHDGLGQTLSLVKLSIEEAARSVRAGAPEKAARSLERLTPQVKSALAELRRTAMNLRPSTLDDLGIVATLSWYFREFEAVCPNIKLEREVSVHEADIPEPLKIAIFRIVQEATSNALKHARAEWVKVCLGKEGDAIELSVEDNGKGFDPGSVASGGDLHKGLGLQSMRERAEHSGGKYALTSAPGKGTRLCVQWPFAAEFDRDGGGLPAELPPAELLRSPPKDMPERFSQCLACLRGQSGAGLDPNFVRERNRHTVSVLRSDRTQTEAMAELKRRAEELMRLEEGLRDLERAGAEFFANLAREFRTPLTLLLGPLQDILDSPGSALAPDSRAVLEGAQRNALRLLKLVDELPQFSSMEDARAGSAGEPTDLARLTAELAGHFRSACRWAGLNLVVDCPSLPERVPVDRGAWEKIVLNLVANAFKSTAQGTIEVRLRVQDGNAQLSVCDTGAGIAENELPYVFRNSHRRAQADIGASERSPVGLGLVRDLVGLHNGSIDVQSKPGIGSTITVSIPVATSQSSARPSTPGVTARAVVPPATPANAFAAEPLLAPTPSGEAVDFHTPAAAPASRSRGRVVIAEDNADMRAYLSEMLKSAGYEVEAVPEGTAALAACRERAPDAVVSDLVMPGMGGFELIERLRADEQTAVIPVLVLSGRAGEDARIAGLASGADDYLVKPLGRRELVARVDGAVRLAQLRREIARREKAGLEKRLEQEKRFRNLSRRLVDVQEVERRKLSAELHDRSSPGLAAIQINLSMFHDLLGARATEDIRALLDDTASLVADTMDSIRDISSNLRPTVLDDGGLLPAVAAYAQQFMKRTGIVVHLEVEDSASPLPPRVESSLFRIVQEALTNCAKHARASQVTLRLNTDSHPASLEIIDDGVGFDFETEAALGLGLLTMRERAEFAGGSFRLETKPGEGTRIRVLIGAHNGGK